MPSQCAWRFFIGQFPWVTTENAAQDDNTEASASEEEVDDARVRLLRSSNLALGSGFRLGLNCG